MPHPATVPAAVVLSLALSMSPVGAVGATEWTLKTDEGPRGGCRVESSRQSMPDGYQQTTVYIAVTPRSVTVVSGAPLDGAGSDIAVAVDGEPPVRMDKLEGDKIAVFDSKYERLVAQFKPGTQARIQLKFWPTWPATGAHSATVSLIGFTKAYAQLAGCR